MGRTHLSSKKWEKCWDLYGSFAFRGSFSKRAVQMFERNISWLKIKVEDLWIHSTIQMWLTLKFSWRKFASEKSFNFRSRKIILPPTTLATGVRVGVHHWSRFLDSFSAHSSIGFLIPHENPLFLVLKTGQKNTRIKKFLVPNPRPGLDGPNASGWYGRIRGPILTLSVIICDQFWQESFHVWYFHDKVSPSPG